MSSQSRLPHLVRGTTAAMIATFASLFSHVIAGGDMPALLGIATPLVLSLTVCILLAGRTLSLLRLSVSVIASQALFHTLFVLGTPLPSGTTGPTMTAGHTHGAVPFELPAALDSTATLVHGDMTMWISHVLGAVVTILFLYRGEEAIGKIRDVAESFVIWVGGARCAVLRLTALPATRRPQSSDAAGWTVLAQLQVSTLRRRGPPARLHIAR
ncbi:hypothetical protein [Leucobacter sp. G161]|uniref:hypothetical protein n=1 Tax=Leucobacter sp. G161 TaxID=663704 RepID=UPI00128EFB8C|nr:hypothetical protein [Leucobacter sp. G161]